MTDQHPITPPPELVQQWSDIALTASGTFEVKMQFATLAAQWGADQELEACLGEVSFLNSKALADRVRTARRSKPPKLKEQALMALEDGDTGPGASLTLTEVSIIRRALEELPDD